MRFIGLCLITGDVPLLSEFYKKVLGVEGEGDSTHMELDAHGTSLAIFSIEGMEQMAPGSMKDSGYGSFTINFEVEDVDTEYEKITKTGVSIVKPPQTHPWGARSFWFRDPDGNIVNFVSRVR
jgi:predicted enzyme related to lactoylglutathione lyase